MPARFTLTAVFALVVCFSSAQAHAGDQAVSVVAVGEVQVRPDTLVLSGTLAESSEKMKDAVTAFGDTRRRALAALDVLEIDNLSISTSALSIELAGETPQVNPFGGDVAVQPPGSLTLSQTVTLTITGVDQLEEQAVIDRVVKLINAAKESGLKLGSPGGMNPMLMMQMGMEGGSGSAVVFKISDPAAAQRMATKDAVDKARADAQYLAELAGGKIGRVLSIGDAPAASEEQQANPYAMIFGMMMDGEDPEFGSSSLEPITVARGLTVRFELVTE